MKNLYIFSHGNKVFRIIRDQILIELGTTNSLFNKRKTIVMNGTTDKTNIIIFFTYSLCLKL